MSQTLTRTFGFAIGQQVNVYYPTHGRLNVLRKVNGEVIATGNGPKGPFVTVQEANGEIRSLSYHKIVFNLR